MVAQGLDSDWCWHEGIIIVFFDFVLISMPFASLIDFDGSKEIRHLVFK